MDDLGHYDVTKISGPYGPKILAPAVGLVLLASLAKENAQTDGQTWRFMYIDDATSGKLGF